MASLSNKDLVDEIVQAALARKAENITILDLKPCSTTADWFIICHGSGPLHTRAISDEIITTLKKKRTAPWHTEGTDAGRWIVIDYFDAVVHIMLPEVRSYYELELLWKDAKRTDVAESLSPAHEESA